MTLHRASSTNYSRTKPEDALTHLDAVESLAPCFVRRLVPSIAIQSLLHIGAHSLSHFLNAVERHLTVLRALPETPEAKEHVLELVANFWNRSHQHSRPIPLS
jgi:hypothetical protein